MKQSLYAYKNVNKQFAQTIFDLERTENDFIWIQDYHLMLVGSYLRQMENKNNFKNKKPMELGFFLHYPF
uniref:Trehalose-6-phosphate synthase n=1 Tax=Meloidogyne incognita TaxID=6306 RepID=A0A914NWE6_MELIC